MPPIKPNEVIKHKKYQIPEFVFEAFNELIALNWNGSSSTIYQQDIKKKIIQKWDDQQLGQDLRLRSSTNGEKEGLMFAQNWLDIEGIYEEAGWSVEYDKPGYCESYDANFIFRKKHR